MDVTEEPDPALTVTQRVILVIDDIAGIPNLDPTPETNLQKDLGADELDIIEIVMELEEQFEIEISDEDYQPCITVQDFINLVEKELASGQ